MLIAILIFFVSVVANTTNWRLSDKTSFVLARHPVGGDPRARQRQWCWLVFHKAPALGSGKKSRLSLRLLASVAPLHYAN